MIERPFDVLTPMGGSFNFDPRGAWTAIDAGYSPNDQKHQVAASPVVEFLAAWGLEHARPYEFETRRVRYSAWGLPLSPMLARAALTGSITFSLKNVSDLNSPCLEKTKSSILQIRRPTHDHPTYFDR